MSGMDDALHDELVEEHLRYLRGEGPEPDLSELSESELVEGRRAFEIVDALAESLPESPPMDQDRVAFRLGLMSPSGYGP